VFRSYWLRLKRATRPKEPKEMSGASQTEQAGHKRDLEHEFSAEEKLERAENERRRKEAPEVVP